MSSVGIPDILKGAQLARARKDAQERLDVAQTEMASLERSDVIAATNGDPMRLFSLDTEIARIDSRLPLMELAQSRADAAVTALGSIREAIGELGVEMLEAAVRGDRSATDNLARDAETLLAFTLSSLNVDVGGRHAFGGNDADHAPVGGLDALMTDVRAALSGSATGDGGAALTIGGAAATGAEQLAGYFGRAFDGVAPPSFDQTPDRAYAGLSGAGANFYTGGAEQAPPVELAHGAKLSYGISAAAPEIRDFVMQLSAMVAYSDGAGVAGPDEMFAGLQTAAAGLITANDGIIALDARLGLDQARLEDAVARAQAERASLVESRTRLIGVDPYEAATRVTEIETQLETIYAMTARASRLSLLNYL